jgi:hypothetical protein
MSLTAQMIADTRTLLQSGGVSVTVYSSSFNYDNIPPTRESPSSVETATVHIYAKRGTGFRDEKGAIAESTHVIYFPQTSSVAVFHRIVKSGETDFYRVLRVDPYEDHNRVWARKVENRT